MNGRSKGALLLARTGKTQDDIAKAVTSKLPRGRRVSRVAVAKWMNGTTKPDDEKRAILETLYGVVTSAWNERPPAARSKPTSAEARTSAEVAFVPVGALAKADALELHVHSLMCEVQADERSTPVEKARVYQSCATTLVVIMKLRGEMPMTRLKFLASEEWRRIAEALESSLKPFPKAAASAADAMRLLDEDAA
jgi:transcriptional regulator with XRE-family HTH domain